MSYRVSVAICAMSAMFACSALIDVPDVSSNRVLDGGSVGDGGGAVDGPASEGSAPRACTDPAFLFCARFDADDAVESGWTTYERDDGAPLALDGTQSVSPPRSLRIPFPNGSVRSILRRDLGAAPAHIVVAFSVRPAPDDAAYVEIVRLTVGDSQDFRFRIYGGTSEVHMKLRADGGEEDQKLGEIVIPRDAWTRVVLDLDVRTRAYALTYGATKIGSGNVLGPANVGESAALMAGSLSTASSSARGTFYLDDVTVEALPE
jgi:hypothetical protein